MSLLKTETRTHRHHLQQIPRSNEMCLFMQVVEKQISISSQDWEVWRSKPNEGKKNPLVEFVA